MGTLIWLLLAQALPVLVLASDTNNDTLLYDDDEYSLISQDDTETSGDEFFEDLIIARLDALDDMYRKTWIGLEKKLWEGFTRIGRTINASCARENQVPSPTEAATPKTAKNEGERGLTLTQTSDTGHTGHTDDNTGSWFHSQNILHVTFLGLVVIFGGILICSLSIWWFSTGGILTHLRRHYFNNQVPPEPAIPLQAAHDPAAPVQADPAAPVGAGA